MLKTKERCLIKDCRGVYDPKTTRICQKCGIGKCSNGHCLCNASEEVKYAVETMYCRKPMIHDVKKDPRVKDHDEYSWDFIRMPAIGKKGITVLEALLDSAQICLSQEKINVDKVKNRIHRALRIVRNALTEERHATPDDYKIKRCTFRETKKTRCNRSPAKNVTLSDGRVVWRCKKHLNAELYGVEPEVKQRRKYRNIVEVIR